jgi:hypothetical protein
MTRLDAAEHEVLHGAYAQACGMQVEWISLTPAQVSIAWGDVRTLADCRTVCAVLCAPYIVTGQPWADSDDWYRVQVLRRAWERRGPIRDHTRPLAWREVVKLAWDDVERWYGRPGVAAAVDALSLALVSARFISGRRWRELWSEITT